MLNGEKKYKNGLVLGKFYPPHLGHLHLIKTGAHHCEKLFVLICSLKHESIDGILRFQWLCEIFKEYKNIQIIHITDENPQYPNECGSIDEFYNDYWIPTVYNNIDKLDVVFTSEKYGEEFAQYLNIKHHLVDLERKTYPISGTNVRDNPYKYWNLIPQQVKKYYMKKIAILGPESTGKSTLTKHLVSYYSTEYIEEYGRKYTEQIKTTIDLNTNDFNNIAIKHHENYTNLINKSNNQLIIADTDVITTKVFGELYINNFYSIIINEIIEKQNFDLYLLLYPSVPFINDGTRNELIDRIEHFNKLENNLKLNNKNYLIIDENDYSIRLEKIIEIIDKLTCIP